MLTCHALAMRLVGASFAGRANRLRDGDFDDVLRQAVALLRGEGLPPDEADESRERLLAGFRWILVDEYQDVNPARYELVGARCILGARNPCGQWVTPVGLELPFEPDDC